MQVAPIKAMLKPPGTTERLKLNCHILLSTSAFELNLRHYIKVYCWLSCVDEPAGGCGAGSEVGLHTRRIRSPRHALRFRPSVIELALNPRALSH